MEETPHPQEDALESRAMTTPTWEPVGQEVLEDIVNDIPYILGLTETEWYAMAAELLAARALLVALVEAENVLGAASWSTMPQAIHQREKVKNAIRAHVARLQV